MTTLEIICTVIFAIVLFSIIALYFCPTKKPKVAILIMFCVLFFSFAGFAVSAIGTNADLNKSYEKHKYNIYSFELTEMNSEKFTLGYSIYKGNPKYYFYTKEDDPNLDLFSRQSLNMDNTYIRPLALSSYSQPCVVEKKDKGNLQEYYIIYLPQNYTIKYYEFF